MAKILLFVERGKNKEYKNIELLKKSFSEQFVDTNFAAGVVEECDLVLVNDVVAVDELYHELGKFTFLVIVHVFQDLDCVVILESMSHDK